MSIIQNYERVAYGFKEEHVCPSCFTTKLHPSLQNLYTIELTRSCWQNLEMIKIIECTICRQVIMFVRREIRQIVSKHSICSYVEAINATGHLNSRAVLWYNDCLLKVTDDIVTMWLNTGKVAPIRPIAVPVGNNDQPNRSNVAVCKNISSVAGMSAFEKQMNNTTEIVVTGDDTWQGGSSASSSSVDTPIDLCTRNTNVQIIDAIVKETSESSAPRNRNEQIPAVAGRTYI